MTRERELEKQFKIRYNRVVKIYRDIKNEENRATATVEIKYKDRNFILKDYMVEGKTHKATIDIDDKIYVYPAYLLAEIHLADYIGQMEG